jgi:hypothetical protein
MIGTLRSPKSISPYRQAALEQRASAASGVGRNLTAVAVDNHVAN